MDPQDSVLDISSKEPFVCLKRIDNISPKNTFNFVKNAKKEPIVILEDIGNENFGLPSTVRVKKKHINDINHTKSSFIKKIGNIEKQKTNERLMKIASQQDESLSERVKFTIGNNDMIPMFRSEFSPLITDSNISNAEISSETHVNLDTEDILKNVRDDIDYDAAITNRNNNFDSLTLKKLCVKFKATVQIVRLNQNLRTNTCFSGKSYTKNLCNLDHKKFKRCLFNANVCNTVFKEKPLTDYESNSHKLKVANNISNEKKKISPISIGRKRPTIDKITNNNLKRFRLNFDKTNWGEKESNLVTEEISTRKHDAPLAVLFSDHKTVPSDLDNGLKSCFSHRSVSWKQPCTNKIYNKDRKRVRFDDANLTFDINYYLKKKNVVKHFNYKIPTVVLKRLKINTTESKKIIQESNKVNQVKTKEFLVSDSKIVNVKLPNDLKKRSPDIFVPCKQPFINTSPAVNLKILRFDDETVNYDKGLKVLKNSNQINPHLITPKLDKTVFKYQERKEKYCKEIRVVVKRLRGDIIKKHLSMLSYPRNINNYGNIHMQKSSNLLQKRNLKLQCHSPSKNSLMFSVLQYNIDHTNILSNSTNKYCKKNKNSSIFPKKKNLGRKGNNLNVAFKVFCTLQLSYNIHKVNALLTRI